MGSMLDVIGSIMVFGIVLLLSLQLNVFMLEKNTQITLRAMNQEKLSGTESYVGLGGIMQNDLLKIGTGDSLSPSILVADSNRITFRGDVDGNGTVDSVKYFITTPSYIPAGGNPNLKYLFRRQNTESGTAGWIGVSSVQFSYLDNMGRSILAPVAAGSLSSIRSIRVKTMLEGSIRLKNDTDTTFAASYWERLFSPENVR